MSATALELSPLNRWFQRTFVPLCFILLCPPATLVFWYTNVFLTGSFSNLFNLFQTEGFFYTVYHICSPYFFGSPTAWAMIAIFAALELLLMRFLPGKKFLGPITPAGNQPVYKANGIAAYLITLLLFYLGAFKWQLFTPTIIYDNFGSLLGALNLFSLLFCLFLLVKGHMAPSSSDHGSSGNKLFDYYWGMELYPRILGWDVKMFTNCRFGMMSWGLILISFAAKQSELYGLSTSMIVSAALQIVYITKFFLWETGYLRSMDIMHDRAGYYICWGCLVWVPGVYTSPALYLVNHPNHLSIILSIGIFALGTASILANYFADRQRQKVRATHGLCKVWGKTPTLVVANYTTEKGEAKQNLLLASGWWGIARHFHYIPEILGAFFWSVPALFDNFFPYFYVIFLIILLAHRAYRDDERCAAKYGQDWDRYCQKVPYKFIPALI